MSAGSSSTDTPDRVVRSLVAAVCLEADRERVLADLAASASPDLADQVAVVLAHQPATQAVLVDVLAELGVAPGEAAAALDLEPVDVELLLAAGPAREVGDEVDDAVVIRPDAPTDPTARGVEAAAVVSEPPGPAGLGPGGPPKHVTGGATAPEKAARRRRLVVALVFFVVAVAVAVGFGLLLP